VASTTDPALTEIISRVLPGARVSRVRALGRDDTEALEARTNKAAGYGAPLRIDVESDGARRSLVLHGTSADGFGHDRRADRAAESLLAADTFSTIPRHTSVLDVGAFRPDGTTVSLSGAGELYLLTDYVEGTTYATDLRRVAQTRVATPLDFARVDALADYLAALHTPVVDQPFAYQRSLRDLLGSGEGIFGIVDAYRPDAPGAEPERLQRIEARCLEWRWRLRAQPPRPTRIHGDFHPFNVLFDSAGEVRVLDTSRGSVGDAADDVSCMAVNFVFFAVDAGTAWEAAFAQLWRRFWERYLELTNDQRLLSLVAPFIAWRLLVLGCPQWYPNLTAQARARLLDLIEAALERETFDPALAEAVFR
jgi:aminoglycoside phosphotransferase (APT) family kinase protein